MYEQIINRDYEAVGTFKDLSLYKSSPVNLCADLIPPEEKRKENFFDLMHGFIEFG